MAPYPALFFSSLSLLAFEVVLVRVFSVRFSYHFASLIITISMMGLIPGALIARRRGRGAEEEPLRRRLLLCPTLALALPLMLLASSLIPFDPYRLLWQPWEAAYGLALVLLFAVPFFIYGVLAASLYSLFPQLPGRLYAADLAGGATGALAALIVADHLPVEFVAAFVASVLFVATMGFFRKPRHALIAGAALAVLCIPLVSGITVMPLSPYRSLMQALSDDGARRLLTLSTADSMLDVFESPRIRVAPGLSLAHRDSIPAGTGLALDGYVAGALIGEEGLSDYTFLGALPAALPYRLARPARVLVGGARNGTDMLLPWFFGATEVIVAELDLSVVRFIEGRYGRESPYRKGLVRGSARKALAERPGLYDLIFLSKAGAFPAGTFGLQEDYGLTVEALTGYLKRLSEGGSLFVQLYILPPPRYELRLFAGILSTMKAAGMREPSEHLTVFRSWDTINFLVTKRTLSQADRALIARFLGEREFDSLFPAWSVSGAFIDGFDYGPLFHLLSNEKTAPPFLSSYPFDIRPATDDRPFFHYFLKTWRAADIYRASGKKWPYFIYEGMALPFLFTGLFIGTAAVFLLLVRRRQTGRVGEPCLGTAGILYFICIGTGFMFLEVFFITTAIRTLETPMRAFAFVVALMLVSSGAGSLATGSLGGKKAFRLMIALLILVLVCVLLHPFAGGTAIAIFLILPTGFLLGCFFPEGLRLFCRRGTEAIPFAYACNGAASILAPLLASLVAVAVGCRMLLVISGVVYTAGLLLLYLAGHGHEGDAA